MDRSLAVGPRIVDFTGVEGDIPAIRGAIESLAAYSPKARIRLLASVLFGADVGGEVGERRKEVRAELLPLLESRAQQRPEYGRSHYPAKIRRVQTTHGI